MTSPNIRAIGIQKRSKRLKTSGSGLSTLSAPSNDVSAQLAKAMEEDALSSVKGIGRILLQEATDPEPVERKKRPLFFDASRNGEKYTYFPEDGYALERDGTRLNLFTYKCLPNSYTKDLFGNDIEKIKGTTDGDGNIDINALSSILRVAFADLLINASEDCTSYFYLSSEAVHAVSDEVKTEMGDLASDGGIALALVTEHVSTATNLDTLYIKAVEVREDDSDLSGIEYLHEQNARKAYASITPARQTQGLLLQNGVDTSSDWAKKLTAEAPTLKKLLKMDFSTFSSNVDTRTSNISGSDEWDNVESLMQPPSGDELVAHKLYAGLLGTPPGTSVPAVRGLLLENGISLNVANKLEEDGMDNITNLTDKDLYHETSKILMDFHRESNKQKYGESGEYNGLSGEKLEEKLPRSKKRLQMDSKLRKNMMGSRQEMAKEKSKGNVDRKGILRKKHPATAKSFGSKVRGSKHKRPKRGSKVNGGRITASSAGKLGSLGKLASGAGAVTGALGALAGPVGIALALAPIIQDMAGAIDRGMEEDLAEVRGDRDRVASEVQNLLESVNLVSMEENLDKRKEESEKLIQNIKNSEALKLSTPQGMALQQQLQALETDFSPTAMTAIQPFTSDAELVAAVNGGQALSAVALFVTPDVAASTPQRKLLQTPNVVNMMGPTTPYFSRTHRSTSEAEMTSFVSSSRNSGFSTATKGSTTTSGSGGGKINLGLAGGKAKITSAKTKTNESNGSFSNDSRHKQEMKQKVTEALVSEFMYMPTKTFSLKEGGLVLTDYAYFRIQGITDEKDMPEDPVAKEMELRSRAREFIHNFGSHIPFGTQTLGGVFVRTMKVTTKSEKSVSEMYSAASARLTQTAMEASKTEGEATTKTGLFGLGASVSTAASHATASSSGTTVSSQSAQGSGAGKSNMDSTFQSYVTCYGPNAPTPDSLYQQLMTNNATWAVIDRGEPDSYFAIWDLVDYIGQGRLLREQCKLLREVWEEMALKNSQGASKELLDVVMKNAEWKQESYDFVMNLIACMVPKNHAGFDSYLSEQFERVVVNAVKSIVAGDSSPANPNEFILNGFNSMHEGMEENVELIKFELVNDTVPYDLAEEFLLNTKNSAWRDFTYYGDTFASEILEKCKPHYLVGICRECFEAENEDDCWKIVDKIVDPDFSDLKEQEKSLAHKRHTRLLKNSLLYKDDEIVKFKDEDVVTTQNHCLHYVLNSLQSDLVNKVYHACPSVLGIKNKAIGAQDLIAHKDHKTPEEIINENPTYRTKLNLERPDTAADINKINFVLAKQSSLYENCVASNACNGDTNSHWHTVCAVTANSELNPWWEGTLEKDTTITKIKIYNRSDSRFMERIKGFRVRVISMDNSEVTTVHQDSDPVVLPMYEIDVLNVVGRKVKIDLPGKKEHLQIGEVEVYGVPTGTQSLELVNINSPELWSYDNISGWHEIGRSKTIGKVPCSTVNLKFAWRDQGYGNFQGQLRVRLVHNEFANFVNKVLELGIIDLHGSDRSEYFAVDKTYDETDNIVKYCRKGFQYVVEVWCNYADGHRLYVKDLKLTCDASVDA